MHAEREYLDVAEGSYSVQQRYGEEGYKERYVERRTADEIRRSKKAKNKRKIIAKTKRVKAEKRRKKKKQKEREKKENDKNGKDEGKGKEITKEKWQGEAGDKQQKGGDEKTKCTINEEGEVNDTPDADKSAAIETCNEPEDSSPCAPTSIATVEKKKKKGKGMTNASDPLLSEGDNDKLVEASAKRKKKKKRMSSE